MKETLEMILIEDLNANLKAFAKQYLSRSQMKINYRE